jgi:hypothetical protein
MSSPVITFTHIEYIKYKYSRPFLERYPNWEQSERLIDFLYNGSIQYTLDPPFENGVSYFLDQLEKIKLVRIECDRQINDRYQIYKNSYPDFEQFKTIYESQLWFNTETDDVRLKSYYRDVPIKVTYKKIKDQMDRDILYFNNEITEHKIEYKKKLAMFDLWQQQKSAELEKENIEKKLKIKKRWQVIFQKIVRKKIMHPVIIAITTIQHNLKHITPSKISSEKIAQWNAETVHILNLVEDKINIFNQVMKWKSAALKFHNKNCPDDDDDDDDDDSCVNFHNCHPDCEYKKYYFTD